MEAYQNSVFSMGTRFNLLIPGIDKHKGGEVFSSVKGELIRIEKLLSRFLPDSEISRINLKAYENTLQLPDEVFNIIEDCVRYNKLTYSCFDIGTGKITDYLKGENPEFNFNVSADLTGVKNIVLDSQKKTIRFLSPYVSIDLGGYGKGYALQKVVMILKESGIDNAYISFGESSVTCLGRHPYGDYWPVGIQDFYNKEKSIATFKVVDGSVSTSGNLQNNHIVNPVTGEPVTKKMSVSVKSASPVVAEVLSTAFMVATDKQINRILNSFPGEEVIRIEYDNNSHYICKFKLGPDEDNKNIKA